MGIISFKSKWQYIKDNYTDYELFLRYIPYLKIGKPIKSPLRDDKHPSFVVYSNRNGLYFIDLARPECKGNIVELVKLMHNLTTGQAIEFIYSGLSGVAKIDYTPPKTKRSEIYYAPLPFGKIHRDFWEPFGISSSTLKKFNVVAISGYNLNGLFFSKKHAYAFLIGSRIKIYMPGGTPKYLGNTNKNSIQGYTQIDDRPELIITSSLKEVMVLDEIGINAIAPNSENTAISDKLLKPLKEKYKCFILYDNDEAGRQASKVHSELYDIPYIDLVYHSKDLSDFTKANSKESLINLIHGSKALCGLWHPETRVRE